MVMTWSAPSVHIFGQFFVGARPPSDDGMWVINTLMDALMVMFDHDLKGDGGELGRSLADRLRDLLTSDFGWT